jgi:2-polyprenyl-6-methoxyphenol hydroxylase-like FAD-dependent oxidoreductase
MRVVVIGAGVAASAASLALAQDRHDVVLVDRTGAPALSTSSADQVFDTWQRAAVGQFRQPHNFLGLGRAVLRDRFPSVYDAVLRAGAGEVDMASFLVDAARQAGDEDLATIACRRPVFDAALREALTDCVPLRVADVVGLTVRHGVVSGVVLAGGEALPADLILDAAGRNTHASDWLVAVGASAFPIESTACGLLYYSRHYRIRDDDPMPPHASLLGGPRGDLGYLAFAAFVGDNRTSLSRSWCPHGTRASADSETRTRSTAWPRTCRAWPRGSLLRSRRPQCCRWAGCVTRCAGSSTATARSRLV